MVNRWPLLLLYWMATATLAWALSLSPLVYVALALPGVVSLIVKKPGTRFFADVILVAVTAIVFRSIGIAALEVLVALTALSVMRAARPSSDRALVLALIIGVVATYVHRPAAWLLIPISGFGIWSLINNQDANTATARQRFSLGASLAGAAAAFAGVVALLLHVLPWQTALADLFAAIAYPFLKLLGQIRLKPKHAPKQSQPVSIPKSHHTLQPALHSGPPEAVTIVLMVLAALLMALAIYFGWKYWSRPDEHLEVPQEPGIVREELSEREVETPWRRRRPPLTPVRNLVRRELSRARGPVTKAAHETFRQWLSRVAPDQPVDQVAPLYDEVRYGNHPDTDAKRHALDQRWIRHR